MLQQTRKPAPRESQYALEKANEAFGHRPADGQWTEIFIVIAIVTTLMVALKVC